MNGKSRLGIKGRLERLIFYSPDGCWLWIGQFRKEDGYGLIKIDKRLTRVHRVAYEQFKGPIPEGLFVCHHCDVPNCINPDHLFLGTLQENNFDMYKKGRNYVSSGEQNPRSKLTEANVRDAIKLRSEGWFYRQIAELYNVNQNTIRAIFTKRTWSHLNLLS